MGEYDYVEYLKRAMREIGYDMEVYFGHPIQGPTTIDVTDRRTGKSATSVREFPLEEFDDDWMYGFCAGFEVALRFKGGQER